MSKKQSKNGKSKAIKQNLIKYKYKPGHEVPTECLPNESEERDGWYFEANLQPREMKNLLMLFETVMEDKNEPYCFADVLQAYDGHEIHTYVRGPGGTSLIKIRPLNLKKTIGEDEYIIFLNDIICDLELQMMEKKIQNLDKQLKKVGRIHGDISELVEMWDFGYFECYVNMLEQGVGVSTYLQSIKRNEFIIPEQL